MRRARVVGEIVAWWAVAFSVWMISLSTAPVQEYLVAGACALPCGLAAFAVRRALEAQWVLRPSWFKPLVMAPVVIVSDAGQALWAVLRQRHQGGRFETVATGAVGDAPAARSRRAVATFLMSLTPGSYVLDADPETGDLLVHSLSSRGPRMERLVEP
jgi:multisubunit Na+/H+ antiporter MnhE subunit